MFSEYWEEYKKETTKLFQKHRVYNLVQGHLHKDFLTSFRTMTREFAQIEFKKNNGEELIFDYTTYPTFGLSYDKMKELYELEMNIRNFIHIKCLEEKYNDRSRN